MFKKLSVPTIIFTFFIFSHLMLSINTASAGELTNSGVTIIDVKEDYGAKGDGKTDDTRSIQNALDNGSGKIVYFPAGSYLNAGNLTFPDNVTINGAGIGKSNLITSSGNVFLVLKARKNVIISDLSFVAQKTGYYSLIDLVNQSNLLIENCYFEKACDTLVQTKRIHCVQVQNSSNITLNNLIATGGSSGDGLAFVAVNTLTVNNCNIHNINGVGINVTGACSNFTLSSNACINNNESGISITGDSYQGVVKDNTTNNNGFGTTEATKDGINGHRLHDVVISNNTSNGNMKNGISVNGRDEAKNTSCQNVTINGNTCSNNKNQGIYLYFTQYCTVDSNTCLANEGTNGTLGGIALSGATYNTITNNSVHDSGVVGGYRCPDIRLEADADHNTVDKNSIG